MTSIEKYKNIIIPIIKAYLPIANIILFGSRATGFAKEGSDIDIALDTGTKIDPKFLRLIREDLEDSALPIHFDVVDFHSVNKDMQAEILKHGIIWN